MGRIIESLVSPDDWLEAVLEWINLRDEPARERAERDDVQEKLRRLGRAFVDGLIDEPDYQRQKVQ